MSRSNLVKLVVFLILATVVGVFYFQYRDLISFETLAQWETELRSYYESSPVIFFALAFLLYVMVTGLSLPGAVPLSLSYGWFFGFWKALLLVSFASTAGATVAFLLSRYLFRDYIQNRFADQLAKINKQLEKEGAFYLFMLRLMPQIPFFVINAVMGLTPMKTWTYWWVSQLGMLAGTAVYINAGASIPTLEALAEKGATGILTPQLIVAFILLGLFPIILRLMVKRFVKSDAVNS